MSKNIDQLYKETFENFEAPVSDGLWDKIQQNPTWTQHLRRQKIRNMAVYASLAIVVIGTCIALILHQPSDNISDPMEEAETIGETSAITSETTVTENVAQKEQHIETISDIPVQENNATAVPAVEAAPENTSPTIANTTSNADMNTTPQPNTTHPAVADISSDNTKTNTEKSPVKESISIKSGEEQPSETSPTPTPANNNSNASMFSIPNAFTPNGDGLNDVFKPITSAEIISYQLDIFMMNGQHIFSSKSLDYGWNGEYQGSLVTNGTYIYVIKYKDTTGKEHIDKGQLLLMR